MIVNMSRTGFDAPSCSTVYLDKPMRDHVLLQALARVNRPYVDSYGVQKKVGLVVDFVGSGNQGNFVQEVRQATLWVVALEFAGNRHEFLEVLDARFILWVAAVAETLDQAGSFEHCTQNHINRFAAGHCLELNQQVTQLGDGTGDLRAETKPLIVRMNDKTMTPISILIST